MGQEEFLGTIEEVKLLEKKMLGYSPYAGDIEIVQTLDLEPQEYIELTYQDLLNLYERCEKIISTVGMGLLTAKAEDGVAAESNIPRVKTEEVETRLREMTTETLQKAEEVRKEPIVMENAPQSTASESYLPTEIEFEHRTAEEVPKPVEKEEKSLEIEVETSKESEEVPKPVEVEKIETPLAPKIEVPKEIEKKIVVAAVPPALKESPDEAASKKYEQIEEQIREALGGATDEVTLKKKMLELTKELFKEKSFNKREQLKLQISALKNMLAAGAGEAGKKVKKGASADQDTHSKLLETIINTQQTELSQTKDSIIDSYNKQIATIKKKFYEDIAILEDLDKKKQVFEGFVFSVTSLVEQLPEVIKKYQEFTIKKHTAELEKLRASLDEKEKGSNTKAKERLDYIQKSYDNEFATVRGIIGREIESLIDGAGKEIFKTEGEVEDKEAKALETVKEINETDEGTLLYYIHSKDQEYYKKYERKQISKAEAIVRAKLLMAQEKGLSDVMVRKYFSEMVG